MPREWVTVMLPGELSQIIRTGKRISAVTGNSRVVFVKRLRAPKYSSWFIARQFAVLFIVRGFLQGFMPDMEKLEVKDARQ